MYTYTRREVLDHELDFARRCGHHGVDPEIKRNNDTAQQWQNNDTAQPHVPGLFEIWNIVIVSNKSRIPFKQIMPDLGYILSCFVRTICELIPLPFRHDMRPIRVDVLHDEISRSMM